MDNNSVNKSLKASNRRKLSLSIPPFIRPTLMFSKSPSKSPSADSGGGGAPRRRRSSSREDEFRQVFRRFDSDDDGRISAYELRAYFGSIGEHMSHDDAETAIRYLDSDGDGLIDFEDFLKLMMQRDEGEKDEDLKAAFEMFEYGKGSGKITPRSLQKVLNMLGDPKSYDECVSMIKVFDVDGNGELDFREFQLMMTA